MARVEMAMDCRCLTGESPVSHASGEMHFVDIEGCTIHGYDTVAGRPCRNLSTEGRMVGNVVPCASPAMANIDLLASLQTSVVPVSFSDTNESKVREHIAIVPDAHLHAAHTFRFNDGKVDPCGRLWAGTMATDALENPDASKLGRLYCVQRATTPSKHTDLAATYEIVEKLGDIGISNGLEWSGGHMYYIDSLKLELSVFDFDENEGAISNRRRVFHIPREGGVLDGMTVDAQGKLWVAIALGGAILQIDPETQTELLRIQLPVLGTTSLVFGGKDLSELYVTSGTILEDKMGSDAPQAGGFFKVHVPGVKGHSFSQAFTL